MQVFPQAWSGLTGKVLHVVILFNLHSCCALQDWMFITLANCEPGELIQSCIIFLFWHSSENVEKIVHIINSVWDLSASGIYNIFEFSYIYCNDSFTGYQDKLIETFSEVNE